MYIEITFTTEAYPGGGCKCLTTHNSAVGQGVKRGPVQSVCGNFREAKCSDFCQDLAGKLLLIRRV